jgi:hypothetical protein
VPALSAAFDRSAMASPIAKTGARRTPRTPEVGKNTERTDVRQPAALFCLLFAPRNHKWGKGEV